MSKASDEVKASKAAWAHLCSLPVHNPERPKLKDVVKGDFESLQKRAHKYLTLAAEYNERKKPNPLHFDGAGIYAKFVANALRRRPVGNIPLNIPDFRGYEPTFARYVERFDEANGLKPGVEFYFRAPVAEPEAFDAFAE
jgi:hypothetical protein